MTTLIEFIWNWLTGLFLGIVFVIIADHDNIDFYHGKGQQMWWTFICLAPIAFGRLVYFAWPIINVFAN